MAQTRLEPLTRFYIERVVGRADVNDARTGVPGHVNGGGVLVCSFSLDHPVGCQLEVVHARVVCVEARFSLASGKARWEVNGCKVDFVEYLGVREGAAGEDHFEIGTIVPLFVPLFDLGIGVREPIVRVKAFHALVDDGLGLVGGDISPVFKREDPFDTESSYQRGFYFILMWS